MKKVEIKIRFFLILVIGILILYNSPILLLELNKKVTDMGFLPLIKMTYPIVFSGTKADRLAYAIDAEDTATISKIVRKEKDVLEVLDNYFQNTVFVQATMNDKYSSVCKLIELGADPSFLGNGRYSPLWIAINDNNKKYCKLFF